MDVRLESSSQGTEAGVNYTMGQEEDIVRTDELIIKNLKTNKVLQIAQEIGKVPVLSFGNSGGDCAMHNYCLSNPKYKSAAFMLIADDPDRDHANRDKALALGEQWLQAGYHVVSMRDDFKTIYGEGVVSQTTGKPPSMAMAPQLMGLMGLPSSMFTTVSPTPHTKQAHTDRVVTPRQ